MIAFFHNARSELQSLPVAEHNVGTVNSIVIAAFSAVFVAELVGDKLMFLSGILATRYRAPAVAIGALFAFMAKMAVAVMAGNFISTLPVWLVTSVSVISFGAVAYSLWPKRDDEAADVSPAKGRHGVLASFAAILLSEWGDPGQITAAALAANTSEPLLIWIGAVFAMITKACLAILLGSEVSRWISRRTLGYAGAAFVVLLAIFRD